MSRTGLKTFRQDLYRDYKDPFGGFHRLILKAEMELLDGRTLSTITS